VGLFPSSDINLRHYGAKILAVGHRFRDTAAIWGGKGLNSPHVPTGLARARGQVTIFLDRLRANRAGAGSRRAENVGQCFALQNIVTLAAEEHLDGPEETGSLGANRKLCLRKKALPPRKKISFSKRASHCPHGEGRGGRARLIFHRNTRPSAKKTHLSGREAPPRFAITRAVPRGSAFNLLLSPPLSPIAGAAAACRPFCNLCPGGPEERARRPSSRNSKATRGPFCSRQSNQPLQWGKEGFLRDGAVVPPLSVLTNRRCTRLAPTGESGTADHTRAIPWDGLHAGKSACFRPSAAYTFFPPPED